MNVLKNKVAIITGAGSGIGRSTALLFAQKKAELVLSDIDQKSLDEVVADCKLLGAKVVGIRGDVSKPEDHIAIVNLAIQMYDKLDIAINCAGIGSKLVNTGEYPIEEWKKVIDTNLNGVYYGMRQQIVAMLNTSQRGSIVNVASILGSSGFENSPASVAAKHGVIGLSKNAAVEYAQRGIRVNSVGPSFIQPPNSEKNPIKDNYEILADLPPMGRLGKPEEVAELLLFLSSDAASFVTGSYYTIDGGFTNN